MITILIFPAIKKLNKTQIIVTYKYPPLIAAAILFWVKIKMAVVNFVAYSKQCVCVNAILIVYLFIINFFYYNMCYSNNGGYFFHEFNKNGSVFIL